MNNHKLALWYTTTKPEDLQGLVCHADTGENIAVTYDPKKAQLVASAPKLKNACERALEWFNEFVNDNRPWENVPAADIATILYEALEK